MGLLATITQKLEGRALKKYEKTADKIIALEEEYTAFSDEELLAKTGDFKQRLESGETLDDILVEAFATVREAAKRTVSMTHYRVQLIGGMILHEGNIAEMKTGEGKTLVATLPAYLNALSGKSVHIVTVNEYLAARDAEWMGQIYTFLGLDVGLILHDMDNDSKKAAYACDITFGTNNELGFDYLRDNMAGSREELVQRDLSFAIVDEVDSILIDEARTPLIISGSGSESTQMYTTANSFVQTLRDERDYVVDEKERTATLTEEGIIRTERHFRIDNLSDLDNMELQHHINQALKANYLMKRDVDYINDNGEIIIVDEFTGRLMPGRRYSEGLHQAIEAKERVRVARESITMATITFQNFFRLYDKVSGMTGTAKTEESEFKSLYSMDVICVPTNKPMIRSDYNDLIYSTENGKFNAVIEEIVQRNNTGQPVLVGTISIEKSEHLSVLLKRRGISHTVLNAKHHAQEAEIIAQAGQRGSVTISTNMAGRGTDIILGEGVVSLGGLHIIGTERHESRRIDNQLRGRAGRQGDPGSSQFFLSMEDDLMRLFGSERLEGFISKNLDEDTPLEAGILTKGIENAQKTVEGRNFSSRRSVLRYDDVMNKQREVIYGQRRKVLEGEDVSGLVAGFIEDMAENLANMHFSLLEDGTRTGASGIEAEFLSEFGLSASLEGLSQAQMATAMKEAAMDHIHSLEKEHSPEVVRVVERNVLLRVVDMKWREHIDDMDQLRQGISLQAYAQADPIQAFTRESLEMFDAMNESIAEETVRYLFRVEISRAGEQKAAEQTVVFLTNFEAEGGKPVIKPGQVAKNALCPCGSGKKYKRCCGKDIA
ncbi:MAG: preprotein translocase subunit SecA [Eubacteriaceae bacterium]|nr:preprotein translocase subunit SecA [Eubacteriaceae bacterium]